MTSQDKSRNPANFDLHETKLRSFIAQLQPLDWNRRFKRKDYNERWDLERFFHWPPDIFALTSLLLENTGAYRAVVTPPNGYAWPDSNWPETCQYYARIWREWLCACMINSQRRSPRLPAQLGNYLRTIKLNAHLTINNLYEVESAMHEPADPKDEKLWELCKCLLELHSIADETMRGVGTLFSPRVSLKMIEETAAPEGIERLHLQANLLLALRGTLSRIGKHRGIVLPKTRTPQAGLTLRSFSHYLTFHQSEVDVAWRAVPWVNIDENTLNALIVPWPYKIHAHAFKPDPTHTVFERLGHARYFSYHPNKSRFGFKPGAGKSPAEAAAEATDVFYPDDVVKRVLAALDESHRVHLLIFPEAALRTEDMEALKKKLIESSLRPHQMPLIISGLCEPAGAKTENLEYGSKGFNRVVLSVFYGEKWYDMQQDKHHRWKLDPTQIATYGLSGVLTTASSSWESIPIPRRRLSFLTSNAWFTLAPLICEDLARLEPVSDLIRGVGPTLLVALLLDGPQLANRWSARYAGVFADDPGTSVLTVTALGMTQRSIPKGQSRQEAQDLREKHGNAVAAWKDQSHGWQPIIIGKDDRASMLTVTAHWVEEETSDMRRQSDSAVFEFQGVHTPRPHPDKDYILSHQSAQTELTKAAQPVDAVLGSDPIGMDEAESVDSTTDKKQVEEKILDMCELSLFSFYVDALVDIPANEEDDLLKWMENAVGIGSDKELNLVKADGKCPRRPAGKELLLLLRSSIWFRKSVPLNIPTPQFLFALRAVTESVKKAKERTRPAEHRSAIVPATPKASHQRSLSQWDERWAKLAETATKELGDRSRLMLEQSEAARDLLFTRINADDLDKDIDIPGMRRATVELARTAHKDLPTERRRSRLRLNYNHLPDKDVGRILLVSSQSILWAIHNRLSIMRRTGHLSNRQATLLKKVEEALEEIDFHSAYRLWRRPADLKAKGLKMDLNELAGEWSMASGERDGRPLPDNFIRNAVLIVGPSSALANGNQEAEPNETVVTLGGRIILKATFTVVTFDSPRLIDLIVTEGPNESEVQQGIYELDLARARFCFSAPGGARPKEFTTTGGNERTLTVWERRNEHSKQI